MVELVELLAYLLTVVKDDPSSKRIFASVCLSWVVTVATAFFNRQTLTGGSDGVTAVSIVVVSVFSGGLLSLFVLNLSSQMLV